MPYFYYDTTDEHGEERVRTAVTATVDEGLELLSQRGFVDVTPREPPPVPERPPAPLKMRTSLQQTLLWFGIVFSGLAIVYLLELPMLVNIGVIAAVFVFVLHKAVMAERSFYDELQVANFSFRHWDVVALARELDDDPFFSKPPARRDIDFKAAAALWALGRDAEADELAERHRDAGPEYLARRWTSLWHGGRHPEAIAAGRESVAQRPESAFARIDLARALVLIGGAVDEARVVLDEARQLEVVRRAETFIILTEGLVAAEQGEFAAAVTLLHRAKRRLRWTRNGHASAVFAAEADAHLCLALAGAGRVSATDALERAREYLEASGQQALLLRCERAVARP